MFTKTHHAAVDGTSGMELTAAVHDLTPDYQQARHTATISVDSEPSTIELLLRSQFNTLLKPFHFLSVARNTVPGMAKVVAGLRRGQLSRVKNIPRPRDNSNVSPPRVLQAHNVPLHGRK